MWTVVRIALVVCSFVGGACPAVATAAEPADVVLQGGKIITLDGQDRVVQAVAVGGGRVVAAGSDAQVAGFIGPQTRVVRLEGKTVVPGIIESHVHAIGAARASLGPPYADLSSIAEVQEWIRRRAKEVPPGVWIEVPRTDITRLAERRHPTPAELDAACTTHPVAFNAAQKWALNTLAFKTAAGSGDTIPGARVLRDADGKPRLVAGGDGHLRKFMPWPNPSDEKTFEALAALMRLYNQVGITGIYDRASDRTGYELYRKLAARGERNMRVTVTFRRQMHSAADVARAVQDLGLKPGEGDEWVKAGPLKITVDGGIHWGNTHLREPYGPKRAAFYALDDTDYRGHIGYTVKQMQEVFPAGHRLGRQLGCHVSGDAGVDRVLDALEAANREVPLTDRRFTIMHCYFPTPEAVQRGKRLGVCIDTQPYLYYRDSDAIAEVYGPAWAERFIGVGDWVHGGLATATNSDHMEGTDPDHAMNSYSPLLAMYIMVSRRNDHGRVYGPRQKLSRIEALRAMTTAAAHLAFDEGRLGSLEPGKLADMVVLDRDYLKCPEDEIRQIKVLSTMVGGKVVYRRP